MRQLTLVLCALQPTAPRWTPDTAPDEPAPWRAREGTQAHNAVKTLVLAGTHSFTLSLGSGGGGGGVFLAHLLFNRNGKKTAPREGGIYTVRE